MGLFNNSEDPPINLPQVNVTSGSGYQRKMYKDSLDLYNKTKWVGDIAKRGNYPGTDYISLDELARQRDNGAQVVSFYNTMAGRGRDMETYNDGDPLLDVRNGEMIPTDVNKPIAYTGNINSQGLIIDYPLFKKPTGGGLFSNNINSIQSRNIDITDQPKPTIQPREESPLDKEKQPYRYRKTWSRETGWGYEKTLEDNYGEQVHKSFLTPKEYFDAKVTNPNYGGGNMSRR